MALAHIDSRNPIGPRLSYARCTVSRGSVGSVRLPNTRHMIAHITQSRKKDSGNAKLIHLTKLTGPLEPSALKAVAEPNVSSMKPVNTRFVGVPVSVAWPHLRCQQWQAREVLAGRLTMPPMEEA